MVWWEFHYTFDDGESISSGTNLTLRGLPESPSITNQHIAAHGNAYDENTAYYGCYGVWITDRIYIKRTSDNTAFDHDSPFTWTQGSSADSLALRGFYKV